MFNLTVDEAHTFYVGENGWLVHNAGGKLTFNFGTENQNKIIKQAAKRGWSLGDIAGVINNPSAVATETLDGNPVMDMRNKIGGGNMNNPATAYFRGDGSYVVRNNITGEIVQVSDSVKPGWKHDFLVKKILPCG